MMRGVMICIVLFVGMIPVFADSIYDYTFNQHLWTTTIDTNSDNDIEYDVAMPDGTDFNLYVWDTWGEKWYSSKASGNTDWVVVPQHVGYQHYLYLYAYKGEGKWVLSCDKITWIGGSIKDIGKYTPDEVSDLINSNPDDEYYY
jgi:hypothetical protein